MWDLKHLYYSRFPIYQQSLLLIVLSKKYYRIFLKDASFHLLHLILIYFFQNLQHMIFFWLTQEQMPDNTDIQFFHSIHNSRPDRFLYNKHHNQNFRFLILSHFYMFRCHINIIIEKLKKHPKSYNVRWNNYCSCSISNQKTLLEFFSLVLYPF